MVRVLRICYALCYGIASVIQVGDKWRAQVRRRGHAAQTNSFGTTILAEKWARRVESDIDSGRTAPCMAARQALAATLKPSSAAICSRMMNFCAFPVTVIGISPAKRR